MATRKEILKHRDKWILALEDTVEMYGSCIEQKSIVPFEEMDCRFCALTHGLKLDMYADACEYCIHDSPYTKVQHCMDDPGFVGIFYAKQYSDKIEEALKGRITYHMNLIRKLKRAKI